MNRRELVRKVISGGTVLVLVPTVLQSCSKQDVSPSTGNPPPAGTKITIDLSLGTNAVLNSQGGSMIVQSVLVINTNGSTFIALTSICTHQGCTVGYNSTAGNIQCPCHGSVYSTSGSVINGPAPRALDNYPVTREGNILTISV
jgi:cytochrome b6-f complex iron-sulfur subunit